MSKIPVFSPHHFFLSLLLIIVCISPVLAACSDYNGGPWYVCEEHPGCIWHDEVPPEDPDPTGCYGIESPTPTPTPTPTPDNCVSACGYTWTAGFTADDILLTMCMTGAGRTPASSCDICGWQMAAMEQQYPCVVPPSPVPTYSPTPLPTVPPPPPVLPTLPPGPSPGPQVITIGEKDIHDVDFQIPTISPIEMSDWNKTTERNNITSVVGNITDPYFNSVDGFSVLISQIIQGLLYLPNWVMASIYSTVQPIAAAFVDIVVIVVDWGSVPLQLIRLALDNTPFGIQALLIYGVCLEMVIYLLRGET